MNTTSSVCRNILDTQEVLTAQIALLVRQMQRLSDDEKKVLMRAVEGAISSQFNGLVDRTQKMLNS